MPNIRYAWMDGKMIPSSRATVPILTHSLHYGSAVFEGIRCYNTSSGPAVFRLDDHIRRLRNSARAIDLPLRFPDQSIKRAVSALVRKNRLRECYIRPIAFYGTHMGLHTDGAAPHLAIAVWPWKTYLGEKPIRLAITSIRRIPHSASNVHAKISGHYFNAVLASHEARKSGADEALMLNIDGAIAEGPAMNIFFVKGKTLITPPGRDVLLGITRDTILRVAASLGYATREQRIMPKDLRQFSEAFFTGTAVEITPICRIDNVRYAKGKEGPVTARIRETYRAIIHGEISKYRKWLTRIS